VLDYFLARGLTPERLRANYRRQVERLARGFDALDLPAAWVTRERIQSFEELGGFLSLTSPRTAELAAGLARRGVATDHRGRFLRLGPAPYLSNEQLDMAIAHLGEAAREIEG
jgi:kynureninase